MKRAPFDMNAYHDARKIHEGCHHQLGCHCDPPFWLRMPTEEELASSPEGQAKALRELRAELDKAEK